MVYEKQEKKKEEAEDQNTITLKSGGEKVNTQSQERDYEY